MIYETIKTGNNLLSGIQKTKDRATKTLSNIGSELRCPGTGKGVSVLHMAPVVLFLLQPP
jgi:hypothetical protein